MAVFVGVVVPRSSRMDFTCLFLCLSGKYTQSCGFLFVLCTVLSRIINVENQADQMFSNAKDLKVSTVKNEGV